MSANEIRELQKTKNRSGFNRNFTADPNKLSGDKKDLYRLLKNDVLNGEVFPAVRDGVIDFYYKGGCLYRFGGQSFSRRKEYAKAEYNQNIKATVPYEIAKEQNENKNTRKKKKGGNEEEKAVATERKLLCELYKHTYCKEYKSDVVVLDIEVCLNGKESKGMKCDLVLLHTVKNQLMFVEGKVFADNRVNSQTTPEVIDQVNAYTRAIKDQESEIIKEYANHIDIINKLFDTKYNTVITLIPTAKLLVYKTPITPREHGQRSIEDIKKGLCNKEKDVYWVMGEQEPPLDKIWDELCE